ncbi:kinase-like domain-containing protein [Rhizophagus irregularis DAOM 181602=DAOM 197198]|nr:kinase-like domain-containing protein [Rhizophagus irregularis DAOM 181602=DAOM 197198]
MSTIRYELVYATANRAVSLIDYNIYTDMRKQHEFKIQFILTDKLLTDNEKAVAIKIITETNDRNKILLNSGTKRICETYWINGHYREWDSEKQQLRRFGTVEIVLKKLENVESANQSWFEEAKSHLTITSKWPNIASCYAKNNSETKTNSNYTNSSRLFTSKIHQFDNLPEPKNATEGEQEGFHSKTYDFSIPDNVDDFNNSSNQKTSKINNIFKTSSKRLSKIFKKLQINSKNDIQNDNKKETIQQGSINDEEAYNNPNLHSEEQDELEIPDEISPEN